MKPETIAALQKILSRATRLPDRREFIVEVTEPPTTLAEAVEEDIADVLGSIPPVCAICDEDWTFPQRHEDCVRRALECLRWA